MGNSFNKAVDKWGLSSGKFTSRSRKEKDAPAYPSHQAPEGPLYDTVADTPVYSVVNKKTSPQKELHYAEVQVLQSHSASSRGGQRPSAQSGNATEYATINFPGQPTRPNATQGSSFRASTSSKPADILIPPGDLQRPVPKAVRKGSSRKEAAV